MKRDYFFSIVLVLILIIAFLFFIFYVRSQENKCLSNPLVYGAEKITKEYGYEFVGTGFLKVPSNFKSPTITFNSTSINIKD